MREGGHYSLYPVNNLLMEKKLYYEYEKITQKANKGVETRFYANNEPVCGYRFFASGRRRENNNVVCVALLKC